MIAQWFLIHSYNLLHNGLERTVPSLDSSQLFHMQQAGGAAAQQSQCFAEQDTVGVWTEYWPWARQTRLWQLCWQERAAASFTTGLLAAISAFTFHFNVGCCYRKILQTFQMEGKSEQTTETPSASSHPKVVAAQPSVPFFHCLPSSQMLFSSDLASPLIFEGIQWVLCSLKTKTCLICALCRYWLCIKMGGEKWRQ